MLDLNPTRLRAGLLLCALLTACDTPVAPAAPPAEAPAEPSAVLGEGIHPILRLAQPSPEAAEVALELRRVGVAASVAAFQVELRYDAERLEVAGADFPAGILGAWFEVEPGRVRVAGARLEGMEDGVVVSLRFAATGAVPAEGFGLRLEELSSAGTFADLRPLAVLPDAGPDLGTPAP